MPRFNKHGREVTGPPAASCCVCGRPGWVTQVGAPCHWCGVGTYFRPKFFNYYLCPTCMDKIPMCPDCFGHGTIAVPCASVTQADVDAEIADMNASREARHRPVI